MISAWLVRDGRSQECGGGENKTFLFSKFKKRKDFWGQALSHEQIHFKPGRSNH